MKSLSNNGNTLIVVMLAIAVLSLGAFAAYRIINVDTPTQTSTAVSTQKDPPAKIDSKADIKKASNALDSTAIDGDVNPNQLDDDISAL